jgi:hypothetical protein
LLPPPPALAIISRIAFLTSIDSPLRVARLYTEGNN